MNSNPFGLTLVGLLLLTLTQQLIFAENNDFADEVLTPFWQAQPMTESMFFIKTANDQPPRSNLLFEPSRILKVVSATRETVYKEGRDYLLDTSSSSLTLPVASLL